MAENVNLTELIQFSPEQNLQSKTDHEIVERVRGLKNKNTKLAICKWKKDIQECLLLRETAVDFVMMLFMVNDGSK